MSRAISRQSVDFAATAMPAGSALAAGALSGGSHRRALPVMVRVMIDRPSTLERAFQLAKSGHVARVEELRAVLKNEGYFLTEIQGPILMKQLRQAIKTARQMTVPHP